MEITQDARHRFRKHVLHRDNRIFLSPVQLRHVRRYDFAQRHLPDGGALLDAACGSGYGKAIVGVGRHYHGIDIDREPIRWATRHWGDGYQVGSVLSLPFAEDSMTKIVSFETLEHLDEPERALADFERVLATGGVFVGSIPLNHPDLVFHAKVYTYTSAVALLRASGLTDLRVFLQRDAVFDEITEPIAETATGTLVFFARSPK